MDKATQLGTELRHDWTVEEAQAFFDLPFNDLLYKAHTIHRQSFDPNQVQLSTLLSIKTGACPEDCSYCPQSAHYDTGLEKEKLIPLDSVLAAAKKAKEQGASRFCMGAAWKNPRGKSFEQVLEMVKEVKSLGMETCATLGMLTPEQANDLKAAGLDYYNHNLDTSPEYYEKIITTRTYQDRLDTLQYVRDANLNVCCGGIMGLGEARDDRVMFLLQLANMPAHPESVPINQLVAIEGTPLENTPKLDVFEFVKTVAVARVLMPKSVIRLSAGREDMSDECQALCFFAGANSIFYGDVLLTAPNQSENTDVQLFKRLGLSPAKSEVKACKTEQHIDKVECAVV